MSAPRRTTTQRGYGTQHQALRAKYAARMKRGEQFTCAKCGHPVHAHHSWDLGHTADRTTYTGPEHRHCNRSEGAARGNRGRRTAQPSRPW